MMMLATLRWSYQLQTPPVLGIDWKQEVTVGIHKQIGDEWHLRFDEPVNRCFHAGTIHYEVILHEKGNGAAAAVAILRSTRTMELRAGTCCVCDNRANHWAPHLLQISLSNDMRVTQCILYVRAREDEAQQAAEARRTSST